MPTVMTGETVAPPRQPPDHSAANMIWHHQRCLSMKKYQKNENQCIMAESVPASGWTPGGCGARAWSTPAPRAGNPEGWFSILAPCPGPRARLACRIATPPCWTRLPACRPEDQTHSHPPKSDSSPLHDYNTVLLSCSASSLPDRRALGLRMLVRAAVLRLGPAATARLAWGALPRHAACRDVGCLHRWYSSDGGDSTGDGRASTSSSGPGASTEGPTSGRHWREWADDKLNSLEGDTRGGCMLR